MIISLLYVSLAGDEREQIFHKVYSNMNSYLQNANTALKFSREGSKGTAAYYCNNIMNNFLQKVNGSIQELDEFTTAELEDAYERMESYIWISRISEIICITAIIVATVICLLYCVRITSNLDRYKDELEKEVEERNAKTIAMPAAAGANILVAGSSVFGAEDAGEAARELQKMAEAALS